MRTPGMHTPARSHPHKWQGKHTRSPLRPRAGRQNTHLVKLVSLVLDAVHGEVRGSDLLGDATSLALLHIGAPDLVQQLGLARVHVAQDAADGGPQPRGRTQLLGCRLTSLRAHSSPVQHTIRTQHLHNDNATQYYSCNREKRRASTAYTHSRYSRHRKSWRGELAQHTHSHYTRHRTRSSTAYTHSRYSCYRKRW